DYAEKNLCLAVIAGKKSKKEKFAGALESYAIECLLPDGQCLQLATSHYFGDSFCQATGVKFQNKQNQFQHPFSTSWGTSTRAIGALALAHQDERGLLLPFSIAPIQIAFVIVNPKNEPGISEYQKELCQKLSSKYGYRFQFRDSHIYPEEEYELLKINTDVNKSGRKGLFVVAFCGNLKCEETIPQKLPAYSIRCLSLTNNPKEREKCIFCAAPAVNYAFLGRSY
ncbi:3359_t:CDS:2, partial [Entrophospora sp. SA101]